MLGFSAISETPISQSTTSAAALGFLPTSLVTLTASSLLFEGTANIATNSTAATFSLNIDFDAKATSNVTGTEATTTVNDFTSVFGKANFTLSPTTAAFTTGQILGTGLANFTIPSTTSVFNINNFASVEAKANTNLSSVISNVSAEDVVGIGAANIISNSVSTTSVVDTLSFDAKANLTIASVLSNITANDFEEVDAKANITIPSATFTSLVNSFADVTGKATTTLDTNLLSSSVNIDTPTAVIFDYGPYAEQYSKSRVLYVLSQKSHGTELRTSGSSSLTTSNVVHVQVEDRSIYIGRSPTNNTVYIAA
tara:strand:+ start:7019 stop:7951 length:933 start_codon:yes stop_codon:yes gene_type:complete